MRITSKQMTSKYIFNANNTMSRYAEQFEKLETGRGFDRLSQNVSLGKKALRNRTAIYRNAQYSANVASAQEQMSAAENALTSINDQVQNVSALAEKALVPVLPSVEEFPYAIRMVSEVLSSNGSTSQGSICGSTLALMDAGVPIKAPVAGISCGLITLPDSDDFMTMVDIQGLEDFFGDMDFKVGGTHKGITAIQVDIKVDGLTPAIIEQAFEKTRKARLYILDEIILKAIPAPREEVGEYAPKMLQTKVPVDKIRDVIGSGGKVIQKICAECDVKIDINEEGNVFVSGVSMENTRKAIQIVETIANDPEIGAIYKGKVVRLMNFGAFVEIAPGKDGLVHISQLDNHRVERVEDVVEIGDEIVVKVIEIDKQGRINLSRKEALADIAAKKKSQQD